MINLRGKDSLKIQKFVQEMSKIAIAIYLIFYVPYILITSFCIFNICS